ncbi:MAG: energy transducer TonB [Hyphomonadaceae bacterium]
MADVLIVCVREDEPQAKALADMFEAAGFSIGGAPSSDAALRSSGAGVIVWSQASIRSRPFLDAAQRVINADKAVVASLIDPPPPSSVGNAQAFDLSDWDGDPDDPALDPLFFAVDRMVNAARAGVDAPAASAVLDEPRRAPPPPPRMEAPRPAPRPAPPAREPEPERLDTEAEYWRAIRDSKNPADFMDYIARFGATGQFAEVAEIRLKQLTGASAQPQRSPPPAPPPPRPAPRPAPPPRMEAPRREPPQRRPEPAPPTRRPEPPMRRAEAALPPRRSSYERGYDVDMREPPRESSGGGALRAFVLIALLGGAALAGGLYFGGGVGEQTTQSEEVASVAPPPDADAPALSDPSAIGAEGDETAPPVQIAEARPEPQRPQESARDREAERAAERAREQQRQQQQQQQRREEPEPPTPAPTNNWDGQPAPNAGPVSLRPSQQAANTTPNTTAPSTQPPSSTVSNPPAPTTSPAVSTTPAARPQPARPGTVSWAQRPSARRIAELYPTRAARNGVGGRVELDCTVRPDLGLNCGVSSESPAGEGFGRAALSVANSYRANPQLSNGAVAAGARTRIAVSFRAPE